MNDNMHRYEYELRNNETGNRILLHFNYVSPDLDEKQYYDNADLIHYGSNYHGAYYARWILTDDATEYVHGEGIFTSRELTEQEKEKYAQDMLRYLFTKGWVITDINYE